MAKTLTIKKIIGKPLKEKGFVYAGYDHDFCSWMFKREKAERTDWIYIEKSRYWDEIWVDIGIVRAGKESVDRLYGIESLHKEIPPHEIKARYSGQETFERALESFSQKYDLTDITEDKLPLFMESVFEECKEKPLWRQRKY